MFVLGVGSWPHPDPRPGPGRLRRWAFPSYFPSGPAPSLAICGWGRGWLPRSRGIRQSPLATPPGGSAPPPHG